MSYVMLALVDLFIYFAIHSDVLTRFKKMNSVVLAMPLILIQLYLDTFQESSSLKAIPYSYATF